MLRCGCSYTISLIGPYLFFFFLIKDNTIPSPWCLIHEKEWTNWVYVLLGRYAFFDRISTLALRRRKFPNLWLTAKAQELLQHRKKRQYHISAGSHNYMLEENWVFAHLKQWTLPSTPTKKRISPQVHDRLLAQCWHDTCWRREQLCHLHAKTEEWPQPCMLDCQNLFIVLLPKALSSIFSKTFFFCQPCPFQCLKLSSIMPKVISSRNSPYHFSLEELNYVKLAA